MVKKALTANKPLVDPKPNVKALKQTGNLIQHKPECYQPLHSQLLLDRLT